MSGAIQIKKIPFKPYGDAGLWLDPAMMARFKVSFYPVSKEHPMFEFDVQAMSCNHCVGVITQTVKQVDPQARVVVDLGARKVSVESTQDRAAFVQALTEADYPPSA